MTIQKFSSGSKKNCRFFCVCRDLAGFVGQNVLEQRGCDSEDGRHTQTTRTALKFLSVFTLDIYQCASDHLLQHFPFLLCFRLPFASSQLQTLNFMLKVQINRLQIQPWCCCSNIYTIILIPGELHNGLTKADISDLLVLLNITGVVKQNLFLFLKQKYLH